MYTVHIKCLQCVKLAWLHHFWSEKSFCCVNTHVMMMIIMMLGGAVSHDQRQNIHLILWIFPAFFYAHLCRSIHLSDCMHMCPCPCECHTGVIILCPPLHMLSISIRLYGMNMNTCQMTHTLHTVRVQPIHTTCIHIHSHS